MAPFATMAPGEARLIGTAVDTAKVAAILRPETIQVLPFRDERRQVVDIPVFYVTLAEGVSGADRVRLLDLLHRGIPRPLIVFLCGPDGTEMLSLALTHVNRADSEQRTSVIEAAIAVPLAHVAESALHVVSLSRADMWALYQDMARVMATCGNPARTSLTAEEAIAAHHWLTRLEGDLAAVVRKAKREMNHQRRIDLNARGRELRSEIERARVQLYGVQDRKPTVEGRSQ